MQYLGFYTSKLFWVNEYLDFNNTELSKLDNTSFTNLLSQEVYNKIHPVYTLKVFRDGLFLIRINGIAEKLEHYSTLPLPQSPDNDIKLSNEYFNYLNAILILFESIILIDENSGILEIAPITNKDILKCNFSNNQIDGIGSTSSDCMDKYAARYLSSYRNGLPITMDKRLRRQLTVKQQSLEKLTTYFDSIVEDYDCICFLSKITKSLNFYKLGDYNASFILSWFVIESYLKVLLVTWLDSKNIVFEDGKKRINSNRKDQFTKCDSISKIINYLEINDLISFELFNEIENLRRIRNNIVHQDNTEISFEDCIKMFETIKKIFTMKYNIPLELNFNFQIPVLT